MSIRNLYKDQDVLLFKELYSLEKVHGSSANVSWNPSGGLHLSPGGGKYENFKKLFNVEALEAFLRDTVGTKVTIFGESYGGGGAKGQGMAKTYGSADRFIVFDVLVTRETRSMWLDVPKMDKLARDAGLDVVPWKLIPATLEAIDAERDADSIVAIRNGMGPGHIREGVVLRPTIEVTKNNGARVIAKHRRPEFSEHKKEPKVEDPALLQATADADAVAEQWATPRRLEHVLQKMSQDLSVRDMHDVIVAMLADIEREGEGEIVWSDKVRKMVGGKVAVLFKTYLSTKSLVDEAE